MISIQRAYEPSKPGDARRYLVDRIWPRGVKREMLNLAGWNKEVAPSSELRKWFGHAPERWEEFRARYWEELDASPEAWKPLLEAARRGDVTLVYGAHDEVHNNAVALKEYLVRKL